MGGGVGHFVADNRGKTVLVLRDRQDAAVDAHLAARQAEGVGGIRRIEQDEFPLRIRQRRHGRDAPAYPFHQCRLVSISGDGRRLLELLELRQSELCRFRRADEQQL